jgi:hypothetical protein
MSVVELKARVADVPNTIPHHGAQRVGGSYCSGAMASPRLSTLRPPMSTVKRRFATRPSFRP